MRRILLCLALVPIASLASVPARAACGPAATVLFVESAPDHFVVTNESAGPWRLTRLAVRLAGSAGRLIFDTEGGGPGVSAYQPFAPSPGGAKLTGSTPVGDGDEELDLTFADFDPGQRFRFAIDLDDRLPEIYGRTTVTGAEIEGAAIVGTFVHADGTRLEQDGVFGADGQAVLNPGACA